MNFEATAQLLGQLYPKASKVIGSIKLRLEAAKEKNYFKGKEDQQQQREHELAILYHFLETTAEAITLAHEERQSEFKRGFRAGKLQAEPNKQKNLFAFPERKEAARNYHTNRAQVTWPELY